MSLKFFVFVVSFKIKKKLTKDTNKEYYVNVNVDIIKERKKKQPEGMVTV